MKIKLVLATLALSIVALLSTVGTATAYPTKTTSCISCHGTGGSSLTANVVSNSPTAATYNLVTAGSNVAVFAGGIKVGSSKTFVGTYGVTYTAQAGDNVNGFSSMTFTPVAPVPPADTIAPVTTSNVKTTYVTSALINLSATDAVGVTNTYFKLNGGAQTSGLVVNSTLVGTNSLEFWSVDAAGNVETHKTVTFTITLPIPVDVTAPVTTSNAVATYLSNAVVTLSASDGITYYKLNGATQVTGNVVSISAVGSYTLEFWSVDTAGNIEVHKTVTFTVTAPIPVDVTAPVTTSNALATYVANASITLSASDGITYYRLNGGAQVTGKTVSVSAAGTYTLEFWSVDVAGNVEVHKTVTFTVTPIIVVPPVDVTAPVTTSNAKATYVSSAVVTFSTESGAITSYSINGGVKVIGTVASVNTTGTFTITFSSTDAAGNVETMKSVTFTVTDPIVVTPPTGDNHHHYGHGHKYGHDRDRKHNHRNRHNDD